MHFWGLNGPSMVKRKKLVSNAWSRTKKIKKTLSAIRVSVGMRMVGNPGDLGLNED